MTSYYRHYYKVQIFDKFARNEADIGGKTWDLVAGKFPYATGCAVKLDSAEGGLGQISFSIDAPFEEGKAMLSSSMFAMGNLVQVKVGWVDDPKGEENSTWFFGQMNNGGVGLTLSTNGLSGTVSVERKGQGAYVSEIQANKKYFDMLGKTAADNRATLDASNARPKLDESAAKTVKNAAPLTPREMIDQLQTFFDVVVTEAVENGQRLQKAESKQSIMLRAPKYKFVMRGSFDPASRTYPVESVSTNFGATNFNFIQRPEARMVSAAAIDASGEILRYSAAMAGSEQPQGNSKKEGVTDNHKGTAVGAKSPQDGIQDQSDGETLGASYPDRAVGDADPAAVTGILQSLVDHAQLVSGLPVEISILGLPEVLPYENCVLANMGSIIDGPYYIKTVEHSANVSSFMTKLTAEARPDPSSAGKASTNVAGR